MKTERENRRNFRIRRQDDYQEDIKGNKKEKQRDIKRGGSQILEGLLFTNAWSSDKKKSRALPIQVWTGKR